MSRRSLVIHGHCYQPPREDPWLECIFPEGTAAPAENWNRRVHDECYGPLAFARRLDGKGRITEIVNCYEWISFNFGPTLLAWLEREAPATYARILEADKASRARWGYGNAMAQVRHHIIMPLADDERKRMEIAWAQEDFVRRFGRDPEGMWLAETAADTATLEALAEFGVKFTILAPRQAKEIEDGHGGWARVGDSGPDVSQPYWADLPSGRELAIFFYNGPLSQAVAFERLIADGETFWKRMAAEARSMAEGALLPLATDGETYGHHFQFGEMGLAYALEQGRAERDGLGLTNFAAHLAANPPTRRVRIKEPSSWSCVHGVERWRADCGCTTGGEPGWNQQWRGPLRDGLEALGRELAAHFDREAPALFRDADAARLDFGRVLCDAESKEEFQARHMKDGLAEGELHKAWTLLDMVRWSQAMFASCAWFFAEISRVEPRNALTFALRALQLAEASGAEMDGAGDLSAPLLAELDKARPNDSRFKTGRELWEREVAPRAENGAHITALAVCLVACRGDLGSVQASQGEQILEWPGARVVLVEGQDASGRDVPKGRNPNQVPPEQDASGPLAADQDTPHQVVSGSARLSWRFGAPEEYSWTWRDRDPDDPFAGEIVVTGQGREERVRPAAMFWKNRELAVLAWLGDERERMTAAWEKQGAQDLHRFLEYRAHQHGQVEQGFWATRWPGLALAWCLYGAPERLQPDLLEFLKQFNGSHPSRQLLRRHLGALIARMVEQGDAEGVRQVLERAQAMELDADLWQAQNTAWRGSEKGRPDGAEGEVLRGLLGFS